MTARRVEGWKLGDKLPPPGTVVGDVSLHAPGIKFGVVLAPEPSDRVRRITSDDPAVWRPAVGELASAIWSRDEDKAAKELERTQVARWGVSGLALIGTPYLDPETGQIRFRWTDKAEAGAVKQGWVQSTAILEAMRRINATLSEGAPHGTEQG